MNSFFFFFFFFFFSFFFFFLLFSLFSLLFLSSHLLRPSVSPANNSTNSHRKNIISMAASPCTLATVLSSDHSCVRTILSS